MNGIGRIVLFLALSAFLSPGAYPQSSEGQQLSLGDIARQLRGNKKSGNPCPPTKPCEGSGPISQLAESEDEYRGEIQMLLGRRDFVGLDEAAESDRLSKARVTGGIWKLYLLYEALSRPAAGDHAKDSEWAERLALLKDWVAGRPASITARVALAECYYNYGWAARGKGSADTVKDESWNLFDARLDQASVMLVEASKLPSKCAHWYYVVLLVARARSWPPAKTREVLENAIAFEPSYYHSYREFAYNLLPKWSGRPGEAEAFAEEIAQRIGGREGAFTYFEIATVIYCQCGDLAAKLILSWPKIQDGFAVLETDYGVTTLKLNRFALLAYLYRDRESAKLIFARIGDNWDPTVWKSGATFKEAIAWAMSQVPGQRGVVETAR